MKEKKKENHKKLKIILSILISLVIIFGIIIFLILKNTVLIKRPELKENPEIGKWYRITPEDTISSDGSEWHGLIKLGEEKDKVAVYFFGGGVSITPYTSENASQFFAPSAGIQDFIASGGIGSDSKDNPFKDWTFLVIPYATGDFHSGTGEYKYTDDKGKEKTVYHKGYNNYSKFLEEAKKYIGEPETLLITGFSAGGFATSLLADDVIDYFPQATNITVAVDSSLLLYDDWHKTSTELWKSPTEISDRLTSNNLVLDSLTALHEKRGESVKILFDCSVRDDTLQEYQAYIDKGKMEKSKENGDKFQKDLKQMVNGLQENINDVGIYIWKVESSKKTKNTQHTIISSEQVYKLKFNDNKTIAEWMMDAINGNVKSYGLDLLDKNYK